MMNLYLLSFLIYPLLSRAESSSCAVEDGVCIPPNEAIPVKRQSPSCRAVILPSSSGDIYTHGGTAQAYKPNQPTKTEICEASMYESSRHRTATWPFFRSSSSWRPPNITLTVKPWHCSAAAATEAATCCEWKSSSNNLTVEIWQTRPDGTYSSLRPGQEDGDCRAHQQLDVSSSSSLTFTTVAPGSMGSLGGLGPYGYDLAPYGPPVIHILAWHPDTEPLLLNVPMSMQRPTLEPTRFKGSDWRGAAWMQSKSFEVSSSSYNITSWESNVAENSIDIHLDVFLQETTDRTTTLTNKLCRSWIYGLPSSFFVEPISICAPAMLDFFAL